jgi:hypothetical protein
MMWSGRFKTQGKSGMTNDGEAPAEDEEKGVPELPRPVRVRYFMQAMRKV